MPAKKRVLILGGGPAGLASAFALTRTEALRAQFEVTVVEPGWRLGGKCRSGRQGPMNRLDQNGNHYLFGAYDDCFSVAREVFDELSRMGEERFGTFESNFIPRSLLAMKQFFRGQWHDWLVQLPTNAAAPGQGQGSSLGLSDFLEMGLEWLIELSSGSGCLRELQSIGVFPAGDGKPPEPHAKPCLIKLTEYAGTKALELALSLLRLFRDEGDGAVLEGVVWLLRAFREAARLTLAKCECQSCGFAERPQEPDNAFEHCTVTLVTEQAKQAQRELESLRAGVFGEFDQAGLGMGLGRLPISCRENTDALELAQTTAARAQLDQPLEPHLQKVTESERRPLPLTRRGRVRGQLHQPVVPLPSKKLLHRQQAAWNEVAFERPEAFFPHPGELVEHFTSHAEAIVVRSE